MDSTSKPEPKASQLPSGLAAARTAVSSDRRDATESEGSATSGADESSEDGVDDSPPAQAPSEDKLRATKRRSKSKAKSRAGTQPNNVRKLRQEAMMSKAELARRAGVSPLTIDRVESGCPCRMDTKRKILEALGLSPSARAEVWPDIDDQS